MQMAKDDQPQPTKKKSRKQRRRADSLREEFLLRPAQNKWLETHIWHAKRMNMIEKWGYKLANYPNDKSRRAAHRASKHQCVLHDASYTQPVQIRGPEHAIAALLRQFLDPTFPDCAHSDYARGDRRLVVFMHERGAYPAKALDLVEIMWQPAVPGTQDRTAWIWTHPAAHSRVAAVLAGAADSDAEWQSQLAITSLKGEFVRFQFCGPRSHAVLFESLKTCDAVDAPFVNQQAHDVWSHLQLAQSATVVPPGVLISLTVHDPRLAFPVVVPSRLATTDPDEDPQDNEDLVEMLKSWPSGLAAGGIWNETVRSQLLAARFDNKTLQARRSENLIPGTRLEPTPTDARIPVLLVHRGSAYTASQSEHGRRAEIAAGWDLVLPRGWAMEFWLTFVFAGARVGGLRERRDFHFEARLPCFPDDFPETPAYVADAADLGSQLAAKHARTPKSKRPNYDAMQVDSPFEPPFLSLLVADDLAAVVADVEADATSADQVADLAVEHAEQRPIVVLHSPSIVRAIHAYAAEADAFEDLCEALQQAMAAASHRRLGTPRDIALPADAPAHIAASFVRVAVTPLAKGSPTDRGIDEIPPADSIMGYITSGHFSLEHGRGQAIGCCRLKSLHAAIQLTKHTLESALGHSRTMVNKNGSLRIIARVRCPTGRVCRLAALEIVP
nr:hypothetical protein HK105_005559 [Polyrhizophydium stewartii]